MTLEDAKHKLLDFVDTVKADPKKQLLAVAVIAFALGFVFAEVFA